MNVRQNEINLASNNLAEYDFQTYYKIFRSEAGDEADHKALREGLVNNLNFILTAFK